ncbi:hypothetical protein Kfla_0593 [Kribbella flavida DSM 17836]|uniref:DUF4245 domain-containing protein n=1 Tax=Kribbella flavida (strain DSM 17836 / JCM 10339 / NBRC 14399) TaxID=479435 RepID=D2PX66_KRIFD|nr:hypothetical protein [Kribbella flavida]ADB29714.1 hypothetical protein Kfla_0593 [Kribbella flavida DSM 17836]
MLTPRHQALLATLAGMTVGVAVFGTVLAVNGALSNNSAAQTVVTTTTTPTPTPIASDGLDPAVLQYVVATFGSEKSPISAEVPASWPATQSGTRARYADPTGLWQLRFDARGSKQSPAELLDTRSGSIDEQEYKVLSTDNSTLVYTYLDKERGHRMGMSRWIAAEGGKRSVLEITVGGRPQDEAGLRAVLERATETVQLPPTGDDRPS